jgi:predicted dienelactone hydrolase
MLRTPYLIAALALISLLVGACQPVMPVAEQPPSGIRPDAPPYAVRGPHPVGVRDFVVEDGEESLHISMWYPALNPTHKQEEIAYQVNTTLPAVQQVWYPPTAEKQVSLTVKGHAIQDALPDTANGPYPLVIFENGWANYRQTYAYLKEHLASHGFVVMSWDIRHENWEAAWEGAALRPLDTQRTIDLADQLTAPGGELAGLIDGEHLGIIGHSYGGTSTLWAGGGQFSLGWCPANPDLILKGSNCEVFPEHLDEIAAMLGLPSVPEGLWPQKYDSRVDAIVPISPDGDIWGADYEGLAAVKVPTLLMAAEHDTLVYPLGIDETVYQHLGADKSLVLFEDGDHVLFFDNCQNLPWVHEFMDWACYDPVWDKDRGHDLVDHFVTAFLLAELKDDAEAANALAPENVDFLGIHYETTAYSTTAISAGR